MDWNDLRYFVSVARTASLTRTAADLRVSPSTVARRIAELESGLGATLFMHSQAGYFLTDEGRAMLERAEAVEEQMLAFEREAAGRGGSVAGTVRLATSENFATDLVIPALPGFAARHPDLRLEIVTDTATAQLARREADLALRVVRPTAGNVKLRKVGVMTYSVYGSRQYLKRHPARGGDPLAGRAFITWDDNRAHLPAARWFAARSQGIRLALSTSSLPTQIAAVRAGLGLAVLPDFLARDKDLVAVMPPAAVFSNDIWVVMHADLGGSARVRAVAQFLADTVGAHPLLGAGPPPRPRA
ncbi:LysR family transcriptional regulator [Bordetella bronchialis]|uniref:LysR family transcriptional regulator n=1 Tax=Bordetella bronchialis TaxID=463025 RepID=A0A193FJ77_9BORD|nr:LysR family transcriptional regulator [Bordetella bronchialis]ANN67164.1 LysR family transcriptional regulator [Bordetella bronchialis]ANN72250.1 LysR family transcriptional regulator [Bordetella bronchialis]